MMRSPEGAREPAAAISAFHSRGDVIGSPVLRVDIFGYDMDNMKARGWTSSTVPAFAIPDVQRQRVVADTANRLTDAAGIAATALLEGVKTALFQSRGDVAGDLSQVKVEFWTLLEAPFYEAMRTVVASDDATATANELCQRFVATITTHAKAVFDRWCPADSASSATVRRVVTGRYSLMQTLRGCFRLGDKLYGALRINNPCGSRSGTTRRLKEAAT